MRFPLLRRVAFCTALALLSIPALAVYNGVQVTGVPPDQVASGTISFGDGSPQPLVSRSDCQNRKAENEDCDSTYLWFAQSASSVAIGTSVKVTLRDRDGNVTTGTGTVTADGIRVNVTPFPGSGGGSGPDFGGGPGLQLYWGYAEPTLANVSGGLGIQFEPGNEGSEQFVTFAPEDYEGESTGAVLRIPSFIEAYRGGFELAAALARFDAEARETLPGGTQGRGYAHQGGDAPSGATGLAFPVGTALDTIVANDVKSWGFSFSGVSIPGDNGVQWGLGLRYRTTTQDMMSWAGTEAFPGVFARFDEEIEDRYLSVPLTVRKTWNNSGAVRPNVHLQVAPGFYESELTGDYRAECNLCAAADMLIEQSVSDEDDGFSWEGAAGIGLDLHLGNRFVVGLFGRYEYYDHLSFANNRESPLDDAVSLGEDSADGWAAGINFGLEFRH